LSRWTWSDLLRLFAAGAATAHLIRSMSDRVIPDAAKVTYHFMSLFHHPLVKHVEDNSCHSRRHNYAI
jgi:hypothetical protein